MTTSGTTAFTLTARDIITQALADELAVFGMGEAVDVDAANGALRALNSMMKTWQMDGVTWKQETISQAIAAATANVTLPTYVREVNGARFVNSATNERQMVRYERDEYRILPNKAAVGASTAFIIERTGTALVMRVWPVPAAAATVKLDIDRKIDTVTDLSETVDVPEELVETVVTNLALRLMGRYRVDGVPELVARAQMLERKMMDTYRPASYFMGAW